VRYTAAGSSDVSIRNCERLRQRGRRADCSERARSPKSEEGKVTPLDVKAGDKILFGKWSGTEVKIDGEDLIIMKESDILGIVG
jgi:co-chaperonin GroES (HSP10)